MKRAAAVFLLGLALASAAFARRPATDGLIAFDAAGVGGKHDIWIVEPNGKRLRNLTKSNAEERTPAWSPHGTRIAFLAVHGAAGDIVVANANGSKRKQITKGGAVGDLSRISWSPDGTRIAYVSGGRLRVIRADGKKRRTIKTPWPVFSPSWSPDGSRIAVAGPPKRAAAGIWTVRAEGGGLRRVTRIAARRGFGFDHVPSWSPSGRKIAFQRDDERGIRVELVRTRGGAVRALTHGLFGSYGPAWSPAGGQVAFVGATPVSGRQVYIATTDGKSRRQVTNAADVLAVSWQRRP